MEPALPEWMRAARRLAPETLAALFAASRREVIETRIAARLPGYMERFGYRA